MIFSFNLCFYHHELAYIGKTTNEDYKHIFTRAQGTPFTYGYVGNLISNLCKKLARPLFDKSLLYKEDKKSIILHIDENIGIEKIKENTNNREGIFSILQQKIDESKEIKII